MQFGNAPIALFDELGDQRGWKARRDINKKRDLVKSVNVILLNQANQVFMIKARRSLWPGTWGGSCAGLVRQGESTIDAAHRTVLRELAIEAPIQLLDERYRDLGAAKRLFAIFLARTREQPRVSRRDIVDARWVSLGEAEQMVGRGTCAPTFQAALDVVKMYFPPWQRRATKGNTASGTRPERGR